MPRVRALAAFEGWIERRGHAAIPFAKRRRVLIRSGNNVKPPLPLSPSPPMHACDTDPFPPVTPQHHPPANSTNSTSPNKQTDGKSFEVKDPKRLEAEVLPRYYRHGHFTSFVRQLNFYNFKVCFCFVVCVCVF